MVKMSGTRPWSRESFLWLQRHFFHNSSATRNRQKGTPGIFRSLGSAGTYLTTPIIYAVNLGCLSAHPRLHDGA